jgi:hypothetical protein
VTDPIFLALLSSSLEYLSQHDPNISHTLKRAAHAIPLEKWHCFLPILRAHFDKQPWAPATDQMLPNLKSCRTQVRLQWSRASRHGIKAKHPSIQGPSVTCRSYIFETGPVTPIVQRIFRVQLPCLDRQTENLETQKLNPTSQKINGRPSLDLFGPGRQSETTGIQHPLTLEAKE